MDSDLAIIYGTRPEVIKLAPIAKAMDDVHVVSFVTVSTNQHASLLDDTLLAAHVRTDLETDVPDRGSVQSLVSSIGRNLQGLDLRVKAVVVQGDTVSAYAGAVFGFLNNMSVIHVEAGLRTSTLWNPFPEEGLRRAITQFTSLHLAPTMGARKNLEREGVLDSSIVVTGNTSVDAVLAQLGGGSDLSFSHAVSGRHSCVVTLHRRESWGAPIARVAAAIRALAQQFPNVDFICPLHPNPKVRAEFGGMESLPNVSVLDPIPHDAFVAILASSCMIITDSGGIQEEATVLGIPTLVARDETERPEAAAVGVAHLVGTDVETIVRVGSRILDSVGRNTFPEDVRATFGDGRAGVRSALAIQAFLAGDPLPLDMCEVDA